MGRRGFSLIELLIVIAIITILSLVAIPAYRLALMSANLASAVGSIKTIHTAEQQYFSETGRLATSIEDLTKPTALISEDLATGEMSGYRFTVSPNEGGYAVHADPLTCDVTGKRSLYSDQTMAVRHSKCPEPASAASPVYKH